MSVNPWTSPPELKSAIDHAMSLLSSGQATLARRQAEELLRRFPREINCMFIVAASIRAHGDNREAAIRLRALIKRAPDFALAHQELGFACAESGNLYDAIAALQRAVAIEPKLPASWKLMGELFQIDGDENSAAGAG